MTQAAAQHESAKESLLRRLRESCERYLFVVSDIPETAASFRRTDGEWSILECAEHVAVAERQMLGMWIKYAQQGQTDRAQDAAVAEAIADRSDKRVAPDPARPKGRYQAIADAVRDFAANRQKSIEYVESHSEELRGKTIAHPLYDMMDGYQLILLMAGHAERHAAQIEEVKQSFREKH